MAELQILLTREVTKQATASRCIVFQISKFGPPGYASALLRGVCSGGISISLKFSADRKRQKYLAVTPSVCLSVCVFFPQDGSKKDWNHSWKNLQRSPSLVHKMNLKHAGVAVIVGPEDRGRVAGKRGLNAWLVCFHGRWTREWHGVIHRPDVT